MLHISSSVMHRSQGDTHNKSYTIKNCETWYCSTSNVSLQATSMLAGEVWLTSWFVRSYSLLPTSLHYYISSNCTRTNKWST
jgi:hypothetical protein